MFAGEVCRLLSVIFAEELPDDLLGDVAADVLIVVALALHFLFLYRLENPQSSAPLALFLALGGRPAHDNGGSDVVHGFPDEGAIAIGDLIDVGQKFADEGVRGFAAGNAEKHFFLLGVYACRVTQVDVLLRRRIVHAIVHYLLLIFILKLLSCPPKRHKTERKAREGLDEEKMLLGMVYVWK